MNVPSTQFVVEIAKVVVVALIACGVLVFLFVFMSAVAWEFGQWASGFINGIRPLPWNR